MFATLFRSLLALLVLVTVMQARGDGVAAEPRPNVVVFLVDDMGIMDTSVPFLTAADGEPKRYPLNDFYRTPSMQRLAAQGTRINQFCAMSVCSPTRISILTGQNAARHRTTNWINPTRDNAGPLGPPDWNWTGLSAESVTLPRLLQRAGYRTIHVGKAHFGPDSSAGSEPLNLGFDVNVGGRSIGRPGSYYGEKDYGNRGKNPTHGVPHLEKYHGSGIFLTEALTREACHHVEQAVADEQPFFLYLSHYAVHAPFDSDPRFAKHYAGSEQSNRAQAFATLIEGMDRSLGDVLDALQRLEVAEQTLVLFLGDNGSDAPLGGPHEVACAAPLRGKKGAHYEGGMRVPFIAAWAKPNRESTVQATLPIVPGDLSSGLAAVPDLLPTIAEVTGVSLPKSHRVDGVSLTGLLAGKTESSPRDGFLMHYPHAPHRSNYFTAYRDDRWKVVYHYFPSKASEGGHYQLFDLQEDPFESTNLAGQRPEVLHTMMQKLIAALEDHEAVYPRPTKSDPRPLKPQLPAS